MIKTSLTTIALAVLLAACGTAAPLAVPAPELPGAFAQGQGIEVGRVAQPDSWSVFADPALDALVQRGLEANLDLRQAAERVQRSRALAAGAHRLEKRKLVERRNCSDDRRGVHARLTEAGLRERERAWPVYAVAVADLLCRHMSAAEAQTLTAILERTTAALEPDLPLLEEIRGKKGEAS